jgi:hypothetical protein
VKLFKLLAIGALCAAFSSASQGAIITSIAGGGSGGHYATRQALAQPRAIAITPAGDIYLAEKARIRKIRADGVASVIAGSGETGYGGGDGIPATQAWVSQPSAIAVDAAGNVYIADTYNQRIRKIGSDGIIRTIAGTGAIGPAIDGIATASLLNHPAGLAIGGDGLLYIADTGNHVVRRLNADGRLVTVVGNGTDAFQGDGAAALQASLSRPNGLAFDSHGALLIADTGNERIRKVSNGIITTVAGGGTEETDSSALDAALITPYAIAVNADDDLFVMENYASRVRRIHAGQAKIVAGLSYVNGGSGDGGEATQATLGQPYGVATDAEGNLYVADTSNNRVRKVALVSAGLPRASGSTLAPSSFAADAMSANARVVALGDVTGDGRDDIVLATFTSGDAAVAGKLAVYATLADGGHAAPITVSYSDLDSGQVSNLLLEDLNKDGIKDIVLADSNGATIFLGNRTGAFSGRRYGLDSGIPEASMAIMDVNLDGNPDIVHQAGNFDQTPHRITILLGLGNGRFTSTDPLNTPMRGGTWMAAGDVNGDGFKDLVTTDTAGQVYLFEHNAVNGFKPGQAVASGMRVAEIGDFDHDAKAEPIYLRINSTTTTIFARLPGGDGFEQIPSRDSAYNPQVADLNGDRRDDLLIARAGELVVYQQTDYGLSEERAYAVPNIRDLSVGDLDGDGCKDVVALSAIQGVMVFLGQGCAKAAASDVDANGKSDLLWRDDARQNFAIWTMDGATRVTGIGHAVPSEWRVIATGDFNGDGKLDLVWTDGTSMQLWEGRGDGYFNGVQMRSYPTGWRVVASGDVNGDGTTDLLWRNDANTAAGMWAMGGAQIIDSASYGTSVDWWIAGSGDFSGDGRMDVVWTNGVQMQLWRASGDLRFTGDAMPGYLQGWELTATGDVTGDGKSDLMWRHPDLGYFAVWGMDGGVRMSEMSYQPGPAWRVAQTGDFTGDGRTDVIWTNGSLMQLWQSQGSGFTGLSMANYPLGWSLIRR